MTAFDHLQPETPLARPTGLDRGCGDAPAEPAGGAAALIKRVDDAFRAGATPSASDAPPSEAERPAGGLHPTVESVLRKLAAVGDAIEAGAAPRVPAGGAAPFLAQRVARLEAELAAVTAAFAQLSRRLEGGESSPQAWEPAHPDGSWLQGGPEPTEIDPDLDPPEPTSPVRRDDPDADAELARFLDSLDARSR